MITFLTIQEAYRTKIERQQKLKGLKYQCHGSCAYVGSDVSPGCYGCFYSDALVYGFRLGDDFGLPNVCNRNCIYCFEPHEVSQSSPVLGPGALNDNWKDSLMRHAAEKRLAITTECKMQYYAFAGPSEPLLYLPVLEAQMRFLREVVDPFMGTKGWAKVYTNGTLLNLDNILKLREMGFDEVRIHPAASNFSSEVYDNMRLAVQHFPTVTVETPAWPPHREKLFEMLPIIEEIGVQHLDICQIEITHGYQLDRIEKALGQIQIYQAYHPVMDDGGLVEDIMQDVLDKCYRYSVIDCNGFVKHSQSALGKRSYWSVLNQKFPSEWDQQRYGRKLG